MILNGLFFISSIDVPGNHQAALAMHVVLSPASGALMANLKAVNCFITGILYTRSGAGMLRKRKPFILLDYLGFMLFPLFYLIERISWGKSHLRVWTDFHVFGGLSALFESYSLHQWRKS